MKPQFRKIIFACYIVLVLSILCADADGQSVRLELPERTGEWQRVVTASDSNIDVNGSSIVLEPNGIFHATFRTILSKSEGAYEKPGVKYKIRIETIQFDSRKQTYRSLETALFASEEKAVFASGPKQESRWKPLGVTAAKLYGAALKAGPFAAWRIVGVRYADGRAVTQDEDAQLALLFGADVLVEFNRFWIGRDACSTPSYESGSIGDEDFRKWTGKSMKEVGFPSDKVNALKITCERKAGVSELHYLFLGSATRATLLAGGVLIDLDKQ